MSIADELLAKLDLHGAPRRILVIEDQLSWLVALREILEAKGHSVIAMIGVLDLTSDGIDGLDENGKTIKPSPSITEIDAVFLDYNFAGGKHNGATFLRDFRLYSQAPVLGMSTDRSLNSLLESLGATHTLQKNRLKSVLLN